MRWFLVGIINTYGMLPECYKRQCLFKETCSTYVKRATREFGFLAGMKALKDRVSQCKPGYQLLIDEGTNRWHIRLANGAVVNSSYISDSVLEPYTLVSAAMHDSAN
jgi:putative component of membrane protein insertase Oxa1/YidC/SpoIIIJ protein YidD